MRLKAFRHAAHVQNRSLTSAADDGGGDVSVPMGAMCVTGSDGGVSCVVGTDGGALRVVGTDGGAVSRVDVVTVVGIADLSSSLAAIDAFFSLITSSSLPDLVDTYSLPLVESEAIALALHAPRSSSSSSSHISRPFDLSQAPLSYSEAIARPDASAWRAAMDRERQSLINMGFFEEAVLPLGQKAIGLKWVFAYKTDALGAPIG